MAILSRRVRGRRAPTRGQQSRTVLRRRTLRLESLEARQLLSVNPLMPDEAGPDQVGPVDAGKGGPDRIVGGFESTPGAWPWMASLQSSSHFCGGSLIAADVVVTAAHCVEGNSVDDFDIVIGRHDLSAGGGKRHPVAEIIVHPDYDPFRNDSDIALVLLASPSDTKPLAVLPRGHDELEAAGQLARVLGWGRLAEGGALPATLHEVAVPIVANEVANQPQSYDGAITERMLAAGLADGGKDACQGDSGGPLLVSDAKGQSYLAGVVSFGNGCARPHRYGIYTRVSSFAQWIDNTIRVIPAGAVNFTQERYRPEQTAHIRLNDADLMGTASVTVELATDTGDVESVVLVAAAPGRFFGSIPLGRGAPTPGNARLDVEGGEQLRAIYQDADNGQGQAVRVTDTAIVVIDDYGNEPQFATEMTPGIPLEGDIEISRDVDWFRFAVSAKMTYRIDVNLLGSLNDSVIDLYDATGDVLMGSNDDGGPGFASRLVWQPDYDGLAHVKVSGYGSNVGTYQLVVTESLLVPDDHGNDQQSATPIELPSTTDGDLAPGGDVDWFAFTAIRGNVYQFDVQLMTLVDSVVRILDGQGNELAYNDDFDDDLASRVTWLAPEDGVYYIEVAGYDAPDVGAYRLLGTVAAVAPEDDHGNDAATASAVDLPAEVGGQIEIPGDVDWFRFTAVAGLVYNIETRAGSLDDTILRLIAEDGVTKLAENDDHGIQLTSYLQWTATDNASLYLRVAAYSQSQGSYTLAISIPYGDANLDDVFDSSDLVQVFQYGEYEDEVPDNSAWSEGDWDGDGEFTSSDLVIAFRENLYATAASPVAAERPIFGSATVADRAAWAPLATPRRRELQALDDALADPTDWHGFRNRTTV